MTEEILFERKGALGLITLNRANRLNALNAEMIARMHAQLAAWADHDGVAAIAVQSASAKAFCAGGDIRELLAFGPSKLDEALQFFRQEYRLNYAIGTYSKPYIAFMDGVVMGGGAGISSNGAYRVGGDNTLFAMPETAIGGVPDVGASCFLQRAPGKVGAWLALSGSRLGPADAMAANQIDYLTPSARWPHIVDALSTADYSDDADETICEILALNSISPPPSPIRAHYSEIDSAFSAHALLIALAALDCGSEWARLQSEIARSHAPFATHLAFEMLRRAPRNNLAASLEMEFRLTRACLTRGDFFEGIQAKMIDKRPANWCEASVEAVQDESVVAAFESAEDDLRLEHREW
jgi:enoyl-CoA hydratase/carnithine racemase